MPKFSICIPTRERHQTLPSTIQSVLQQTNPDFELIVQDNCSSPETREAVARFDDARIVYHRSDQRISMHENWEQAFELTSGDFLIFVGDDDALMPNCLEKAAELVEGRDVELLAWLAHTYYWPDVPDAKRRNHLTVDLRAAPNWGEYFAPEGEALDRSGEHPTLPPATFCLDSRRLLRNWLAHEGARVYVPAYHNLVSRRIVEKVKQQARQERYFFNPLPDFGTLIANLYVAKEVFFHAAPLSMTGHSGRSAGGTHGDQDSWSRSLERFMAEAKATPEQLLPSVFDHFLWAPPLLAGCFENIKRQMFPDDDELVMGWESFLRGAATQVAGEPEAVRDACRDWILASAARIGVDPASIAFPPTGEWRRQVGVLADPAGRMQFAYLDCERLGAETILDAVSIADQLAPVTLYPATIPRPAAPGALNESQLLKLRARLEKKTAEASAARDQVEKLKARVAKRDEQLSAQREKLVRRKAGDGQDGKAGGKDAPGAARSAAGSSFRRAIRRLGGS